MGLMGNRGWKLGKKSYCVFGHGGMDDLQPPARQRLDGMALPFLFVYLYLGFRLERLERLA
jgi:hypothetical protein